MRTKYFSVFVVVAMLLALLPSTALASPLAAKPSDVTIHVRNQTGVTVQLSLTDAQGNILYFMLDPGVYPITLTEGIYAYYAALPCGPSTGTLNLTNTKILYLSCNDDTPSLNLSRTNACHYKWVMIDEDLWENIFTDGTNDSPDIYAPINKAKVQDLIDHYIGYYGPINMCPYMNLFRSFDSWEIQYFDRDGNRIRDIGPGAG